MSYWKWLLVKKSKVWSDPLLPWRIGWPAVPAANHIKLDILDKPYFPKPYYEDNYIFPKPYYEHDYIFPNLYYETLKKIPETLVL